MSRPSSSASSRSTISPGTPFARTRRTAPTPLPSSVHDSTASPMSFPMPPKSARRPRIFSRDTGTVRSTRAPYAIRNVLLDQALRFQRLVDLGSAGDALLIRDQIRVTREIDLQRVRPVQDREQIGIGDAEIAQQ